MRLRYKILQNLKTGNEFLLCGMLSTQNTYLKKCFTSSACYNYIISHACITRTSPPPAGYPRNFHVTSTMLNQLYKKPKNHQHFYICSCRWPCHGEINDVDYNTFIFACAAQYNTFKLTIELVLVPNAWNILKSKFD